MYGTKMYFDCKIDEDCFLLVLSDKLKEHSFKVTFQGKVLFFSKQLQFTSHTGKNKFELFKFLREGHVNLLDDCKTIYIVVRYRFVLVSACLISLVIFLQSKYLMGFSYVDSFLTSATFLVIYICIGIIIANIQIKRIIYSSLIKYNSAPHDRRRL